MGGRGLPAAVVLLLVAAAPAFAADAGCLLCHMFPLEAALPGSGRPLAVDAVAREGSGHAKFSCRSCHAWVTVIPHGAPSPASGCASPCHTTIAGSLSGSVHGEGKPGHLPCRGCHRGEEGGEATGLTGAMTRCLSCHGEGERWTGYLRSPHGRPLASGRAPGAVCPDCHTLHAVLPPSNPASSIAPSRIADTCRGALAPGKGCHPSAGDSFAGIASGHASPDEAAAARFPVLSALMAAAAGFLALLPALLLLPPGRRRP